MDTFDDILSDEQNFYEERPHWAMLLPSGIVFILSTISFVLLTIGVQNGLDTGVILFFSVLVSIFSLLTVTTKSIIRRNTLVRLTSRRLIIKQGVLSKTVDEIPIHRIEGFSAKQKPLGQLLNFATFAIHYGTNVLELQHVARWKKFQNDINLVSNSR